MIVTKKAQVVLGQHQLASTGVIAGEGLQANCRCGFSARFLFSQLPAGESNMTPYVDGLMVAHQVEMMEAA